jgi:hypothetical protein
MNYDELRMYLSDPTIISCIVTVLDPEYERVDFYFNTTFNKTSNKYAGRMIAVKYTNKKELKDIIVIFKQSLTSHTQLTFQFSDYPNILARYIKIFFSELLI